VVGDYGSDKVGGGIGNDRLAGGPGTDVFAGGVGTDTVTYEGEDASTISIDGIANDGPAGDKDNVAADVENVIGSAAGDTIVGSAAANVLDGAGGDDNIKGGSGNDSLIGGAGNDTLSDSSGLNTLDYRSAPGGIAINLAGAAPQVTGGAGSDTLVGPLGTWATIFGSEFADTFNILDTKKETLDGRGGPDNLTGADGVDVVVNVP